MFEIFFKCNNGLKNTIQMNKPLLYCFVFVYSNETIIVFLTFSLYENNSKYKISYIISFYFS